MAGKSYIGNALRVPPPPFASGGSFTFAGGGGFGNASCASIVPPKHRALNMGPCPNLGGPVHGASRLVKHRPEARHVCSADRFEGELFLAPPLHADAMTRDLHRDDRSVQSRVVGAVVAIAAGAVGVPEQ